MTVTLAVLEVAAVFAAVCATLLSATPAGSSVHALAGQALALAVCSLVAFYYTGLYDLRTVRSFPQSARRVPGALGLAFLSVWAAQVLFSQPSMLSYDAVVAALLITLAVVLALRAGGYRLLESRPLLERVLIAGDSWLAEELVKEIQARPDLQQRVVGLVGKRTDGPAGFRRLGDLSALAAVVEVTRPHRIVVALAARRGQMPLKTLLSLRLRGILVEDGVELYERLTGKIAIEALTPSSLIFSKDYRASRLNLTLARALSLPVSAAALLLLAPVFALIALTIKLESPGPVFFVGQRVGRGGRVFRLIRFRTMQPAGSAASEGGDHGGRLTRAGRWLRRFRLDELPQLLNILKGDMNLVGPRPQPVSNLSLLGVVMRNTPDCGEQIPYCALRSLVRPGITGWAQVRYRCANDLEEEIEKMRYDLYYVKHMSLWLDLRILLETIEVVLRGGESAPDESGPLRAAAPARVAPVRASLRLAAEAQPQLELSLVTRPRRSARWGGLRR